MATRRIEGSFGWIAVATAIGGLAWLAGNSQPERRRTNIPHAKTNIIHLSCGPAALMVVAGAHDPKAASRLGTVLEHEGLTTRAVSSFYDLATAAQRVDLDLIGLKIGARDLSRLPLPAIVHVRPGHFLALVAVSDERVTVIDQGRVTREIPRAAFDRRFSGYVLCLEKLYTASRQTL